jgi:hypothetical protein
MGHATAVRSQPRVRIKKESGANGSRLSERHLQESRYLGAAALQERRRNDFHRDPRRFSLPGSLTRDDANFHRLREESQGTTPAPTPQQTLCGLPTARLIASGQ